MLDDYLEPDHLTPLQKQRERVLWRDEGKCQLHALGFTDHSCSGRPQCAHIPPKQAIKRYRRDLALRERNGKTLSDAQRALLTASEDEVVADTRGAVTMCESGHSAFDLLGRRGLKVNLPDHVLEFVADYGLEPLLDRLFAQEAKAA